MSFHMCKLETLTESANSACIFWNGKLYGCSSSESTCWENRLGNTVGDQLLYGMPVKFTCLESGVTSPLTIPWYRKEMRTSCHVSCLGTGPLSWTFSGMVSQNSTNSNHVYSVFKHKMGCNWTVSINFGLCHVKDVERERKTILFQKTSMLVIGS